MGVLCGGGQKGKHWDNCNSIINKIFFKKKCLAVLELQSGSQVHFASREGPEELANCDDLWYQDRLYQLRCPLKQGTC